TVRPLLQPGRLSVDRVPHEPVAERRSKRLPTRVRRRQCPDRARSPRHGPVPNETLATPAKRRGIPFYLDSTLPGSRSFREVLRNACWTSVVLWDEGGRRSVVASGGLARRGEA